MSDEGLSVEPNRVNSAAEQPSTLWVLWLVLALLVIAVLFCVSQLALMSPANIEAGDMRSGLKADYSLWPPLTFQPLEEALVEELIDENSALPTQIVVSGNYWPTSDLPAVPTLTPTATPTVSPTASATLRPLRPLATRLARPTNTQAVVFSTLAPTATRIFATNTVPPTQIRPPGNPRPTSTDSPTPTSSPTATFTKTATASLTPTRTPSKTPTKTTTLTPTPTATATHTPTPTHTPTLTPTLTPTSSNTPTPSSPIGPLPTGVNLGTPDGKYHNIQCGSALVIDLGASIPHIKTLIFNEFRNPTPSACHNGVCLDQVIIDLNITNDPQPTPWPLRIFYWGDTVNDNNGNIPPGYYPPEIHNAPIAGVDLYNGQGIQIHVDGSYRYIRIAPPADCSDPAQIDSIEIWTPVPPP